VIDVALTPADLRPSDVAVVIDVLRATSTATQALAAGYHSVLFADSFERARGLRAPGRILAGERRCVKPTGFDQGNSPLEAIERRGDELVLATTNGAPAIIAATRHAPTVLLACLLNLGAVVEALSDWAHRPHFDLQIVCSGTDRVPALEDVYLAGRLSALLGGERGDTARIAEAVGRAYARPFDALTDSADAGVLRTAGMTDDIAYCARESTLDVVPRVRSASSGVSVVARGDAEAP
jgi:2-phosphosulfolactate phosphatase